MWTPKCYTRSGGKNEIREFYESRDAELRGKIASIINDLLLSDSSHWESLGAKYAQGNGKGLLQISVKHKGNQYRFLGYLVPETKDFILCDYFTKKNNSDNERAYKRAWSRRKKIEQGNMPTEEYNFSIEANN